MIKILTTLICLLVSLYAFSQANDTISIDLIRGAELSDPLFDYRISKRFRSYYFLKDGYYKISSYRLTGREMTDTPIIYMGYAKNLQPIGTWYGYIKGSKNVALIVDFHFLKQYTRYLYFEMNYSKGRKVIERIIKDKNHQDVFYKEYITN